jgi:hypothetical protein
MGGHDMTRTKGLYRQKYILDYGELGPEKWDELKRKAGDNGLSMNSLINQLLERYRKNDIKLGREN